LLTANLLPACRDGQDLAARSAMLLGAMLAGQAFANAPVGGVHALAYPIGGVFHVPHGLSNALVLPHVLRFNAPAAAPLYAELAAIVAPSATGSDEAKTHALIAEIDRLIVATGIPRTLREVGIGEADLPRMASDAMLQTRLLVNNPREVTEADALEIYRQAW
jgi:alcohol dehydrogenase